MNIAFHSGVSGMTGFQHDMDVLAHNMSNVNTTGFKASRTSFSDALYTQMDINNQTAELTGHGVKPMAADLLVKQGNLQSTGIPLDFAIIGEGFFAVERGGAREYTRNGGFDVSVEGQKGYLITNDGAYVLDAKGKRVEIPHQEGSTVVFNFENLNEAVGVYAFSNPYGLQATDGSSFLPTANSGVAKAVTTNLPGSDSIKLKSQALESSGVDLAQTMVDVMVTQRAFQFNARMVQTADQLEEIVNTLR